MKNWLLVFLWLGFIVMAFGMYTMVTADVNAVTRGLGFMVAGAIVLILFMVLFVREYEIVKYKI